MIVSALAPISLIKTTFILRKLHHDRKDTESAP
jgi:hypothetical protein